MTSVVIEPVWPTSRRCSAAGGQVPDMNHIAAAGRGQQVGTAKAKRQHFAGPLRQIGHRLACCGIQQPHDALLPGGGQKLPVGRIGQGADPPRETCTSATSRPADVPQADHARPPRRGHPRAVGRESDRTDVACPARQVPERPPVIGVEHPHLVAETRRGQHSPVGIIGQGVDGCKLAGQIVRTASGRHRDHVPKPNSPVGPGSGQDLSIRSERRRLDPIAMERQAVQELAGLEIEQPH